MSVFHESNYISDKELKKIVEQGGKDLFYTGWNEYKDSPYAKYRQKMIELGYENERKSKNNAD